MQALKTAIALQAHGLDVTFLCYPGSNLHQEASAPWPSWAKGRPRRGSLHALPMKFGNSLHPLLICRLRRFIRDDESDAVHVHYSRDLRFVVPACHGLVPKRPIVLTKHVGSYVKKKDPLHRYLYSRTDLVIAISGVIRDNVVDTCPVDPARVEVIYNGVNLQQFVPLEESRRRVRALLGFSEQEIVVGMVGRMSPGKGHEEFLHAAKEIGRQARDVRFLVVGGPSFGEEAFAAAIERLCKNLLLTGRIVFTGFRRDVPELMAAMDILAFPSHAEAFGNVAIEAMAMAKPVVSTNCDGVVDIVVDGTTGIHVPPKNSQALAQALSRLIGDPVLCRRFGEAGRRRVEDMFDEEEQTAKLVRKYDILLDASSPGRDRSAAGK